MREKFRVVMDLTVDREKYQQDPPNMWGWRELLELEEDESVKLLSVELTGIERGN